MFLVKLQTLQASEDFALGIFTIRNVNWSHTGQRVEPLKLLFPSYRNQT